MIDWWNGLTLMEQILYCIAIPSTLILLLQTIMTLCGFGHEGGDMNVSDTSGIDFDMDMPDDISFDTDIGDGSPVSDLGSMHFFTMQGIVAFFCIFGWTSIIILHGGGSGTVSVLVGLVFGFIAMFAVAKVMQVSAKMTQSGTLDMRNTLGETGRVYLTVPPKGGGPGKVNSPVQGRFMEFDALNSSDMAIQTGENIRVIDIEGNYLVIEKE